MPAARRSVRAYAVSLALLALPAFVLGVAAAGTSSATVLLAGVSGLLAGAASMAAGEYVSVKAQTELVERELQPHREARATSIEGELGRPIAA